MQLARVQAHNMSLVVQGTEHGTGEGFVLVQERSGQAPAFLVLHERHTQLTVFHREHGCIHGHGWAWIVG